MSLRSKGLIITTENDPELGNFRLDMQTGEILELRKGGLYSPLPIPAYKILAQAKEHIAKDVLICLVSHLGKGNRSVFPSYDTIARETGRSRNSIAEGIRTLQEFEFIKVFRWKEGKHKRNRYYLQDACWKARRMNDKSSPLLPLVGVCTQCKSPLSMNEVQEGSSGFHHLRCGGRVLGAKKLAKLSTKINTEEGNQG